MNLFGFFVLLFATAAGFAAGWFCHASSVLLGWVKQPLVHMNLNLQIDDRLVINSLQQKGYIVQRDNRTVN